MKKFREFDSECVNSTVFNRYYKWDICNQTGKCSRCPWHGGMDNSRFSRKPKTDKYKNKNRISIRKYEKNV